MDAGLRKEEGSNFGRDCSQEESRLYHQRGEYGVGRLIEPKCKQCRREGLKLYLKGMRCFSDKCAIEKRNFAPGQHGKGRTKLSDYGIQLREKQKMKKFYGVLERQFRKNFHEASRMKGVTGDSLIQLMERRLDNAIYRLLWALSRAEGRQMVHHKKIFVNGVLVDIPSYLVSPGDEITVRREESTEKRIRGVIEKKKDYAIPAWLESNQEKLQAKIIRMPEEQDAGLPVEVQQIIELYSK
ncbi:MAG: 30S ribosomal protein S4 [Candidatus Omnitrophica bacterium]|nr:30S ribosomal protein S4 [Candidatus Omnitrophota bacterium]